MNSKAKVLKRKALPIEELHLKYNEVVRASAYKSPTIQAIVSAALTEKALVTLLSNYFVQRDTSKSVLSENGALGEFSKCADMAYCLGLISGGMLHNLKLIGKIRNLFAHAHEFIDFNHPEVAELCSKLAVQKAWIMKMKSGSRGVALDEYLKNKSSRRKFTSICSTACVVLIDKASKATHRDIGRDTFLNSLRSPSP
jgi:DNA-binding MltR family transcriptional regulator